MRPLRAALCHRVWPYTRAALRLSGAKSAGRPYPAIHSAITSALHGAVGAGASLPSAASAAIVTDGGRVVTTDLDEGRHGLGSSVAWADSNTARPGGAAQASWRRLSFESSAMAGGATTAQS